MNPIKLRNKPFQLVSSKARTQVLSPLPPLFLKRQQRERDPGMEDGFKQVKCIASNLRLVRVFTRNTVRWVFFCSDWLLPWYIWTSVLSQALPSTFRQRGLTDREQMDSDIIREYYRVIITSCKESWREKMQPSTAWRWFCGVVVSALISGSRVRVRALARDIVLCSWAGHLTLTVPLSTQVYK